MHACMYVCACVHVLYSMGVPIFYYILLCTHLRQCAGLFPLCCCAFDLAHALFWIGCCICVFRVCVCVLSHMCCFLSVICTYGVEHLRLHICFCICVVGNVLFHGCRFVCVVAYVCLAAGIGERHGLGKMPTIISGKKRGRKRSAVNVLITLMHTNRC